MFTNLKKIYSDKIVENIKKYDYENFFYFFNPDNNSVFGIEKTISSNEYKLIKTNFIEKKIYNNNNNSQKIYEYLFESGKYPFKEKKVKMIIVDTSEYDFCGVLKNIFDHVESIVLSDIEILFCSDSIDDNVEPFVKIMGDDLGISFRINEGIYINSSIPGEDILKYISIIKNFLLFTKEEYTDVTSPILSVSSTEFNEYIYFIDKYILSQVFNEPNNEDMIVTYLKNDLNVSKTSKDLYMNRNSFLNKIENIYTQTGFNLLKFKHACAMHIYLENRPKENAKNNK